MSGEGERVIIGHGHVQLPYEPVVSGRDILSDLERAHSWRSPIVLSEQPAQPRPAPQALDHDQIALLYSSGLTAGAVARQVGCAKVTVYRSLERSGVPRRDHKRRRVTT
jgi:helix-turn-helix resolvase-like protein